MNIYQNLFSGYLSPCFRATAKDGNVPGDRRLPEELLFTQSNSRVMLGYNPMGQLRFITLPTTMYPVPVSFDEEGHGISYYPGTYYQCDQVMLLGNIRFKLSENGQRIPAPGECEDDITGYVHDVLPVTFAERNGFSMRTTVCAPFDKHNLPFDSPAGAVFMLYIENRNDKAMEIEVALNVDPVMVDTYRCTDFPLPDGITAPQKHYRQQTLILEKPEGYAAIHLRNGAWDYDAETLCSKSRIKVDAHSFAIAEVYIALARSYHDIMPTIYRLCGRRPCQWIQEVIDFWSVRLGKLDVSIPEDESLGRKTRDLYIRCLIDNFNCLQMDENNQLIAHWQGAPAHNCGTIWGIDIEPTALSVMQVCPEMALKILEFFIDKSHCPSESWKEHSMPIMIAPLIIAGEYYAFTGDLDYFENRYRAITNKLRKLMDEMLSLRSASTMLFPSRYSSDAHVFRRYDFGTNVKCYRALIGFSRIVRDLGSAGEAHHYDEIANQLKAAIKEKMVCDGPFGPQLSGGTNLDEGNYGGFYIDNGNPYYDGEDSQSCMAPLSGIMTLDDPLWVNYHRFARSLWCPNFDPEFNAVRWFHDGGPLDGTAYISALGGSIERDEMLGALDNLFDIACDETGSIFWWPLGTNWRRGNTICSQGQGAWAQQYLQQWLGIQVDAPQKTISVALRGLPSKVVWKNAKFGNSAFDIAVKEEDGKGMLELVNHNADSWRVKLGVRPEGTGATDRLNWVEDNVTAGASTVLNAENVSGHHSLIRVEQEECSILSNENGFVFDTFEVRTIMETHQDGSIIQENGRMHIQLRLVIEHRCEEPADDVMVRLVTPEGWKTSPKELRLYSKMVADNGPISEIVLGTLKPRQRAVASFWISPPERAKGFPCYDRHSFAEASSRALLLEGTDGVIHLTLSAGGREVSHKDIAVSGKSVAESF